MMNTKQLTVLLAAVLLLSLSEMFPPWLYKDHSSSRMRSAGYHYVKNPPDASDVWAMREIFKIPNEELDNVFTVERDSIRIYFQRIVWLFFTLSLLLALAKRRTTVGVVLSIIFLEFGAGFSTCLVAYSIMFK